jgi:ubiquinone/menaquinone biosynthesis C-methylase UbiE
MARTICPPWLGYFLINPLRKLIENPEKILGQFVREGMVVLEPGCGMGFFTLPLARMVGPKGRVVVAEIQQKMLSVLSRRAEKAGLLDRIELRHITAEGLGVEDLSSEVDFVAAIHMVHEVPDQTALFSQVWEVLKPGCKMLVIEPKGHVSPEQFEQTVGHAKRVGFSPDVLPIKLGGRAALLTKS